MHTQAELQECLTLRGEIFLSRERPRVRLAKLERIIEQSPKWGLPLEYTIRGSSISRTRRVFHDEAARIREHLDWCAKLGLDPNEN